MVHLHDQAVAPPQESCRLFNHADGLFLSVDLVVIGLMYMAYHDRCRHKVRFLPRLRPHPVRGIGFCFVSFLLC